MPETQSMRVLIVDDQTSMRGLLKYSLEQLGFRNVEEASSGAMALEALKINKYDLIISDWNMENVDGLQLLKIIRANPLINKTPFIMSTGNKDRAKVQIAIQSGVNNYIVKPFNVATLRTKIEAVIGKLT